MEQHHGGRWMEVVRTTARCRARERFSRGGGNSAPVTPTGALGRDLPGGCPAGAPRRPAGANSPCRQARARSQAPPVRDGRTGSAGTRGYSGYSVLRQEGALRQSAGEGSYYLPRCCRTPARGGGEYWGYLALQRYSSTNYYFTSMLPHSSARLRRVFSSLTKCSAT